LRHLAYDWICAFFLAGFFAGAHAQSGVASDLALPDAPLPALAEVSHARQSVPRVPGVGSRLSGFNAGLSFSGAHSSVIGWYQVVVPAVSYTISPHFSADVNLPVYIHRLVRNTDAATASQKYLVLDSLAVGDTQLGLHGVFRPHNIEEIVTLSLMAPTGKRSEGLGTGRVTFDLDNYLEKSFGKTALHLSMGIGDSSGLANDLFLRDYNTLGALSHFQSGASFWICGRSLLQVDAYEQLPIGDQKIYSEFSNDARGADAAVELPPAVTSGLSEDNGLTVSLGIPLASHVILGGYYNRSLRQKQDMVSMGVTYVWHGMSLKKHRSMIERALREAAGLSPDE